MNWYRVYHGMPNDPKFALVQRHLASQCVTPVTSQQVTTRGAIVSVWTSLMDFASQNNPRGSLDGLSVAEIAVVLDYSDELVSLIISGFEALGMITDNYLKAWAKRQPFREDDSTHRMRKMRAARSEQSSNVTHSDANVTQSDAVTPSRARRRDGDETETRREVLLKPEVVSNSEAVKPDPPKGQTDGGVTKRKKGESRLNGTVPNSVPFQSPSVSNSQSGENFDPEKTAWMAGTLHAYMEMSGTNHERRFKAPDQEIVVRCLRAVNGASRDEISGFLHDRYSNYEQSPRHAKGPKKYAWFETVLKSRFSPNGDHA